MTFWVFIFVIAVILAINIFLWKSGFLIQAEHPTVVDDKPVLDVKERKAFLKRLKRWKEEGKISREEYEHISALCGQDWGA